MKSLIKLLALLNLLFLNSTESAKAYGILNLNSLDFMANGTGNCTLTSMDFSLAVLSFDREVQNDCGVNQFIEVYSEKPYKCSFNSTTPFLASVAATELNKPLIVDCEGDIKARSFVVPNP